jgi:hypothetical protein
MLARIWVEILIDFLCSDSLNQGMYVIKWFHSPYRACRIPGGFCRRKLLQITAEYIAWFSMRLLPLAEAA